MTNSITIRRPDDMHVHFRDGDVMPAFARETANIFARGLVMPNLTPPVLTGEDALAYKARINAAVDGLGFEPLMTIKITSSTTPEIIKSAKAAGVIAGKLYPEGVTTNSEDGVTEFRSLLPVFEAMADVGMVLCVHAESPGVFVMEREVDYLPNIRWLALKLRNLRIVIEHATTEAALIVARNFSNVACSITVHHLLLTLDDVVGGMLQPHYFCKPIAKTPFDRSCLLQAALSGEKRFFLGTDSAPHHVSKKECASGCAGVYTAPVALQTLAEIFERAGKLDRLEAFTSEHGADFYQIPRNIGQVVLTKSDWKVPAQYGGVVPFRAGQTVSWAVEAVIG